MNTDYYKYNELFKSTGPDIVRAIRYAPVDIGTKHERALASRLIIVVRADNGVTASFAEIVGDHAIRRLKEACEFALSDYREELIQEGDCKLP